MARVELLDLDNVNDLNRVNNEARAMLFGNGKANTVRVMAHAPLVTRWLPPLIASMQRNGAGSILPARIKAMVDIKTSDLNKCAYCIDHNTSLGRAAGLSEEDFAVVTSDRYMNSDRLTAREKAAVLWAEHVTLNTAKYREDVFETVRAAFSEAEIVELTLLCAFRNLRNRFHDALQLDLDPPNPDPKAAVGADAWIDPDKLKAYLQHLLDNWPDAFPQPAQE